MVDHLTSATGAKPGEVGTNIYQVVAPPEHVNWARSENAVCVGDYGWYTAKHPENGLIHLTGYDSEYKNIWMADFTEAQVRLVCPKPAKPGKPNPYPVLKGCLNS